MSLILPQNVNIKWTPQVKKHLISRGYVFNSFNDDIEINVLDLPNSSSTMVAIKCDYCDAAMYKSYKDYNNLKGDTYCCPECLKSRKKTRDENGNLQFILILYRNKEWLFNEYITKDREASDIAQECGINQRTLREWMNILCIKKNQSKLERINKDDLIDYYTNKKLTSIEIGEIYNVSEATIMRLLRNYGVYIPNRSEIMKTYYYEKDGIQKACETANKLENRIISSCRNRNIEIEEFDGFISSENKLFRGRTEYENWRNSIFIRDKYTCQACGKHGGNLNAHHILNYSSNLELRTDIENGITLCEECHLIQFEGSFHSIYGEKNNNKEQLDEFIKLKKEGVV